MMGVLELLGLILAALVGALGYGHIQRKAGMREGAEAEYARQKARQVQATEHAKKRMEDALDREDGDPAAALERLRAEADRNAE